MDTEYWKEVSEIVLNAAQVLAYAAGVFVLYKYVTERRDRATEVLLQLEKNFNMRSVRKGRMLVEDDKAYDGIRGDLMEAVGPEDTFEASDTRTQRSSRKMIPGLDQLLRFYVLLCGVRAAKQVPDASLMKCFRFWLAHFYSPSRRELKLYISKYYPTLTRWLLDDRKWRCRPFRRSFFTPESFGFFPDKKPSDDDLRQAARGRVLIITGAGVSRESGIPTYRGTEGYWGKYDPRMLARRTSFDKDPRLIWNWYAWRRGVIHAKEPNAAHHAIAQLCAEAAECLLVTQNVDDLHERAFTNPSVLVHVHGRIRVNQCIDSACRFTSVDAPRTEGKPHDTSLPRCPACGKLLRPGVVWFDEDLDPTVVARVEHFLAGGKCDLVLVVGTTASFPYIINWALRGASHGGYLIEVNPEPTHLSPAADLSIRAPAGEALPRLFGSRRRIRRTRPSAAQRDNKAPPSPVDASQPMLAK